MKIITRHSWISECLIYFTSCSEHWSRPNDAILVRHGSLNKDPHTTLITGHTKQCHVPHFSVAVPCTTLLCGSAMYHTSLCHVPHFLCGSAMYHTSLWQCHVPHFSVAVPCTTLLCVMYHTSLCHVPHLSVAVPCTTLLCAMYHTYLWQCHVPHFSVAVPHFSVVSLKCEVNMAFPKYGMNCPVLIHETKITLPDTILRERTRHGFWLSEQPHFWVGFLASQTAPSPWLDSTMASKTILTWAGP